MGPRLNDPSEVEKAPRLPVRTNVLVSSGTVLLMVGYLRSSGTASMRKPVMGSILALQVSVTEASLTSDIFTRRGGLRSEEPISKQECFNTAEMDKGVPWVSA